MRSKSNDKMIRIVEYINDKYFDENYIPTMQEIADYMGMSKGNVSDYLKEMSSLGMIDMNGGWRNLSTNKIDKVLSDISRVPIVGSIACGTPMLAEENIDSYLTISGSFLGPGKYFGLKATGNSMIKANINDGDIVIVRQQNTANEGDIIVALIDDKATLKRYYKDTHKRMVRLHPENDEMEDMFYKNVAIQGIAVKIVKDAI
ncbi:MAG: transcriptional repressor LexA [Clostridia bacterium]|nr:transcriptional repressor LexA [Clostridia bacterium]